MSVDCDPLGLMPEVFECDLPPQPLPEVPAWLLEAPLDWDEPPVCDGGCACGGAPAPVVPDAPEVAVEPVPWAVPGMWEHDPTPQTVTPSVGGLVLQLQQLLGRLATVAPAGLAPGQALGEAEALLTAQRDLRVLQLARTADVSARALYEHRGFRTVAAWERSVAPDAKASDRSLGRALVALPHLHAAVIEGRVSLAGAGKTATALGKVRRYLDCLDGLVDGLDGEAMVTAVAGNVLDLICQHHHGLNAADPAQAALLAELQGSLQSIVTGGGGQADRIEQVLVLLTTHLPLGALPGALEDIVFAIVPSLLEHREQAAQDRRGLALTPQPDGTWELSATLTPECGEQLFTALAAEARRDPANPLDTLLREQHRHEQTEAAGLDPFLHDFDTLPAWEQQALNSLNGEPGARAGGIGEGEALLVPRSRTKRLHDALQRLLQRYLSTGLGGTNGKVPVQASAVINARTLEGLPGAPPARGGSGRPLARSLVRRWWCDTHVTTLLLDHGWTPLGIIHTARTLTGTELKAARVQFDNRCAGDGCCPGTPDPLIPLVPHHVIGHAKTGLTSLGETVLCCETLHHDLHTGKRTIRLRNGRLLNEDGYLSDEG